MNLLRKSPFPPSQGSERDKQHMEEIKLERIKKHKSTGACLYYFNLHMSSSCLSTPLRLNQAWLWKQWWWRSHTFPWSFRWKKLICFFQETPIMKVVFISRRLPLFSTFLRQLKKFFQFIDYENKIYFLLCCLLLLLT